MKDHSLPTPPGLSAAEAAVSYVLRRIQLDADLRWHMLHTQTFELLCTAEALLAGKTKEEIAALFSTPANDDKAQLPELRERVRDLESDLADCAQDFKHLRASAEKAHGALDEQKRCINLIRHYLMFNDQRAFFCHEAQDCIDAIRRGETAPVKAS